MHVEPRPARLSRQLAIGLASLACLATSSLGSETVELRGPFLINWTQGEVDARVVMRATACVDGGEGADIGSEVEARYLLAPAELVDLSASLTEGDAGTTGCGAAYLRVGDASVRVSWDAGASEPITRELPYRDSVIVDAG